MWHGATRVVPNVPCSSFGVLSLRLNCLGEIYVEFRCPGTFVDLSPGNFKMYQFKFIITYKRVNISGVEGNCPFSSLLPSCLIRTA